MTTLNRAESEDMVADGATACYDVTGFVFVFFFQAEDGIRDLTVTGVQTCALPISVLLIMSLGLAVTFGLMGIINMAHGEMLMIGSYTAYVVQEIFQARFAASQDYYFFVALPLAFLAAGLVGLVLELGVIRFLYGRPLETLIVTWGVGMILQQAARLSFADQTAVNSR